MVRVFGHRGCDDLQFLPLKYSDREVRSPLQRMANLSRNEMAYGPNLGLRELKMARNGEIRIRMRNESVWPNRPVMPNMTSIENEPSKPFF
jgi:hypothetical protein